MSAKLIFLVAATLLLLQCASARSFTRGNVDSVLKSTHRKLKTFLEEQIKIFCSAYVRAAKEGLEQTIVDLLSMETTGRVRDKIRTLSRFVTKLEKFQLRVAAVVTSENVKEFLVLVEELDVLTESLTGSSGHVIRTKLEQATSDFQRSYECAESKFRDSLSADEINKQHRFTMWSDRFVRSPNPAEMALLTSFLGTARDLLLAAETDEASQHETEQPSVASDDASSKRQRFMRTEFLKYADGRLSSYKNALSLLFAELAAQGKQSQNDEIAKLKKFIQRLEAYQPDEVEAAVLLAQSSALLNGASIDPNLSRNLKVKISQVGIEAENFMQEFTDKLVKFWNSLSPEERSEQEEFGVQVQNLRQTPIKILLGTSLMLQSLFEGLQIHIITAMDNLFEGAIPVYKEVLEYVLTDLSALHNKNQTVEKDIIKIKDILKRMDQGLPYKGRDLLWNELVDWMHLDTSRAFINNSLNKRSMSGYLAERLSPLVNWFLNNAIKLWNSLSSKEKMAESSREVYSILKEAEAETDVVKQIYILVAE